MKNKLKTNTLFALIGAFSFVLIANAQNTTNTPSQLPPMPPQSQNMMETATTNGPTAGVMISPKQDKQNQQPQGLGAPKQQDGQIPPQQGDQKGPNVTSQKKLQQIIAIEPNGKTVIRGILVSAVTGSIVIKSWGMNFTIDTTKVRNAATLDITKFTAGDIVGITGKMSDTGTITAKTILNKEFNTRQKLEKKTENKLEKKDNNRKDDQEKPKLLPPMTPLPPTLPTGAAPTTPVTPTIQ